MNKVTRITSISNAPGSSQRRQLAQRLAGRIRLALICAYLDGRTIAYAELIEELRLLRKRPSIARQIVDLALAALRTDGTLPAAAVVAR